MHPATCDCPDCLSWKCLIRDALELAEKQDDFARSPPSPLEEQVAVNAAIVAWNRKLRAALEEIATLPNKCRRCGGERGSQAIAQEALK